MGKANEHVLTDAERAAADRFWMEIAKRNPRNLNVRAELHDFHFIIEQLPKVYMHVTGGRLSKHMYHAKSVIGVADEHVQALCDEAVRENQEGLAQDWAPWLVALAATLDAVAAGDVPAADGLSALASDAREFAGILTEVTSPAQPAEMAVTAGDEEGR